MNVEPLTSLSKNPSKYFCDSCAAQPSSGMSAMDSLLNPYLSEKDREFMSKSFSIYELTGVVKHLNESPGEESLSSQLYKEFKDILMQSLMELLNLAMEEKWFPESFSQATYQLFTKTGKDPLKYASYWLISLLNSDYEPATKVISKRSETFLQTKKVHTVLSRQIFVNIVHLLTKRKWTFFCCCCWISCGLEWVMPPESSQFTLRHMCC